ncbi:MAG: VWA domain-containing protein [Nitrospirae bacterium]|nr:VWA domain-containing protein [Nitrospirota bacterium]
MRFYSPWAFLLLLIIPVILFRYFKKGRTGSIRFPSLESVKQVSPSPIFRFRHLPLFLRLLTLTLLIIGLARPQKGKEIVREFSQGVAIEMVLDHSGSMASEMEYGDQRLNNLEVAKKVFKEFVLGNGRTLKGRPNDLIGMVVFARYADTICPLILDHGALLQFLKNIHIVKIKSEDGTAIGDALALAAARLQTAEEKLKKMTNNPNRSQPFQIKSKVIILLTDGVNNAGKMSPLEAAELARKWGIKIYTIGFGGREGVATIRTPFGDYTVPTGMTLDEETLKAIAKKTGGIYRRATDEKSLRAVYEKIDHLEKSKIESLRYLDYQELFPKFIIAGLFLLLLEILISHTIFRRIP